jgi:hypothetical protein
VPFEALSIADGDQIVPLGQKVPIRYAPLVSLGIADPRPRRAGGNNAVVVGKLMHGGETSHSEAAFEEISAALPGAVALRPPLAHDGSSYATLFDGLIVLDEISGADDDPYDWSPLGHDHKNAGALANWFALPWGGPDFIILPSYHTAAERAMKKQSADPGNEIFLSVCGLMANGARTILLSRWRTGGQSSVDLVREFVQELPHTSAAEAWHRSIAIVSENTLSAAAEPRLHVTAQEEPPKAEHPFFWSGYMLVDTGTLPQELADEQKGVAPESAPQKPESPVAARAAEAAGGKQQMARPGAPANNAPVNNLGGFGGPANAAAQPGAGAGGAGGFGGGLGGGTAGAAPGNSPTNPLFDNTAPQNGAAQAPDNNGAGGKKGAKQSSKRTPRKPKSSKNASDGFPDGSIVPTNPWADDMNAGDDQPQPKRSRAKSSGAKSSSGKSNSSKSSRAKNADPSAADPAAPPDLPTTGQPPANP